MRSNYLSTTDGADIYDDVVEKKALPELILKGNILEAQDTLLLSKRSLMQNFYTQGRFFNEDIISFKVNLLFLWDFISQMVLDQGIETDDKRYFIIISKLQMGKNDIKVKDLIYTSDFLMKCLHKLNITNLFQSKGSDYKSKVANL